jgi:hypothetical protein
MKLSISTLIFIVLAVFVGFCLFNEGRKRRIEGLVSNEMYGGASAPFDASNEMYPGNYAPVESFSNNGSVMIPPPVGQPNVQRAVNGCPEPPPCPPCARCPEPAFDCKKVVNYNANENERFLPQAVLSDFSSFGM